MRRIVEDLIRIEGVIGALLVGKDGLVIASTMLEDEDAEVLGAMAAAMYGTLSKACERIGVGTMTDSIVQAADGTIHLVEAEDILLVVIAEKQVNIGMIKIEMRRASKRVREAIPL